MIESARPYNQLESGQFRNLDSQSREEQELVPFPRRVRDLRLSSQTLDLHPDAGDKIRIL
jgi:hypothetical protein